MKQSKHAPHFSSKGYRQKKIHETTLKRKMLGYTLLIIFLMTIVSVYSLTITNVYKKKIDTMFMRNIALNELSDYLDIVDKELVVFLSTKSSTSLNNYMRSGEELRNLSQAAVDEVAYFTEEELMVLDINNMIYNYSLEADKAVEEKRKSDVTAYTKRYTNTLAIKNYIMEYIHELNIRQLDSNAQTYIYMTEQINKSTLLNIVLIIDLILLSITIIIKMTNSMINPIVRLSHSAEDIARGHFNADDIIVETNDEIQILAIAFNKMKWNIHAYIEELKEKASTEAKLNIQQMENLKMQSLLDNARLYALQSQMNPHFLFNTINAGVQLSMIEGANRTSEFLECMSRLFRYNIKQLDQAVSIKQEVENIKDYYELLKVRFGSLITFEFIIDESGLEHSMPPLILQPIVENAYMHGLSKKEEGGTIKIQVINEGEFSTVTIEDNGVGMTKSMLKSLNTILVRKSREAIDNEFGISISNSHKTKQSNGIGMRNVIERMELFFKRDSLIQVKSSKTYGTKFIIKVPHVKEQL